MVQSPTTSFNGSNGKHDVTISTKTVDCATVAWASRGQSAYRWGNCSRTDEIVCTGVRRKGKPPIITSEDLHLIYADEMPMEVQKGLCWGLGRFINLIGCPMPHERVLGSIRSGDLLLRRRLSFYLFT